MDQSATTPRDTIKDAIVTLPWWGIGGVALIGVVSLVLSIWVAATSTNDSIKTTAIQLLLVIVPLLSAVVAAIAVRRTSTTQIDHLVTGFLEKTMHERFEKWCQHPPDSSTYKYPFKSVRLEESTGGRSYAYYSFEWEEGTVAPSIRVGVKTNVFNFEIFSSFPLRIDRLESPQDTFETLIFNSKNIEMAVKHPIIKKFIGSIQGSINEGYEVKISFATHDEKANELMVHFSLRQKVRENFLASPFLKRYFAEDAAIVIGVIFDEYRQSDLMPIKA